MNPNAQHVQEDNAALVKPGLPNAHVTGDSALQPNTPRLPLSEITISELNQGNSFVSTTSETSLVPTSTSVTIVGDIIDSGSTFCSTVRDRVLTCRARHGAPIVIACNVGVSAYGVPAYSDVISFMHTSYMHTYIQPKSPAYHTRSVTEQEL